LCHSEEIPGEGIPRARAGISQGSQIFRGSEIIVKRFNLFRTHRNYYETLQSFQGPQKSLWGASIFSGPTEIIVGRFNLFRTHK
jgi:hypothetical protein